MTDNRKHKGFTIMEMLIVVAIIAILAAIAIPVFGSSLHKARVAADIANVRAYYAELQTEYLLTGEYREGIGTESDGIGSDTIIHPDNTETKLQAGKYSVIRPSDSDQDKKSGYQLHYYCNKFDHEQTFGASNKTGG